MRIKEMPSNFIWFYAVEEGIPIGIVALDPKREEIRCLMVLEKHRNKGIGKLLIDSCVLKARELGFKSVYGITMDNNPDASTFMEKLGYKHMNKYEIDLC